VSSSTQGLEDSGLSGGPGRAAGPSNVLSFAHRVPGIVNNFARLKVGRLQGLPERAHLFPTGMVMSERDLRRDADLQEIYRNYVEAKALAEDQRQIAESRWTWLVCATVLLIFSSSFIFLPNWPRHSSGWLADKWMAFNAGWSVATGNNAPTLPVVVNAPAVAGPTALTSTAAVTPQPPLQMAAVTTTAAAPLAGEGLLRGQILTPPQPAVLESSNTPPTQVAAPAGPMPTPMSNGAPNAGAKLTAPTAIAAPAAKAATKPAGAASDAKSISPAPAQAPTAATPDYSVASFVDGTGDSVMLRDANGSVRVFRINSSIAAGEVIERIDANSGVVTTNRRQLRKQ
jgi:hypothetical protein